MPKLTHLPKFLSSSFRLLLHPSSSLPLLLHLPSSSTFNSLTSFIPLLQPSSHLLFPSASSYSLLPSSPSSISFVGGGNKVEEGTGIFLEKSVDEQLKILINGVSMAYEIKDSCYFFNNRFDGALQNAEVPVPDSVAISNFLTVFESEANNLYPNAKSLKKSDLQNLLLSSLSLLESHMKSNESTLAEKLTKINSEEKNLNALFDKNEKEIRKIAFSPLKTLLILTCIQWIVLFYVCYYLYGWDFTEPVGYLISLGLESLGIAYFIKKGEELGQQSIFNKSLAKNEGAIMRKISSSATVEKALIRKRMLLLYSRMVFGRLA